MAKPNTKSPEIYAEIRRLSETVLKKDGTPNLSEIGRLMGCSKETVGRALNKILDYHHPEILEAAMAGGIEDPRNLSHFWKIVKDGEGNGYSLFVKNPQSGKDMSVFDLMREAVSEAPRPKLLLPPRISQPYGEHLMVIDLADVHFLKLCVQSETGHVYNREVARHRVIEGTRALIRMAQPMGVGRILFVLGNDILHVDNSRTTTTSGTYQDSDGTIFQGFKDAASALEVAIREASQVADVDLIHCMSNHDWLLGWTLSQTVAARLRDNPNVRGTEYNLSEAHRKYYRFERNLFGLTHADGAKEEKLYGLMVKEARQHISECLNLYWLLHHLHHKIRKTRGEFEFLREKDHNGMTAHITGHTMTEGHNLNIEYVRSPSAPDGWHDRNGYVNRQAVECFIHHPTLGQRARFTEWF
ncbi:hypothetical protein [Mesorhizobium sp. M7A.F.Ca.CA.002.12.1.1]|uniref:hypothetical protein n=1 Tax=Mesorhizobium sp. M7A.F.Ca.CA.002.12.1.1 TaxID=2496735 RepID=UPI000FCAA60D|nr:hypothetical protein [Mesorhizobium sp. M7A.F.Ca.CA.002.12.1.1]RUX60161.1 hypothetical protein EN989_11125 [Mesorhizobium sp. M7A.F.Ca.CA.002.12.1.1]